MEDFEGYADCESCNGFWQLELCPRCEAWFCSHCLECHKCDTYCDHRERLILKDRVAITELMEKLIYESNSNNEMS
jgi:hypothetical protein